jgi:MoaA/NifB/PqqE/SkfB family radical SAM enzyme
MLSVRKWFSDTTPSPPGASLWGILSSLDRDTLSGAPLAQALESLDSAKPALFDYFRTQFGSTIEAKAVTVKVLNLCLARYHYSNRGALALSLPLGLVMDPANSCNLACPGCVHSAHSREFKLFDWNPGILSEARATSFLRGYGPQATHITLCNYGEPLVNPLTPKFVRLSKSYLLRTMFSTNLSLPRFDAEAYADSGLDYMVLSIDGATQPVYERFRRKGNLDLVIENIRKLVAAKRRLGGRAPVIVWRFLAFEHNVHEIPAAMEKAKSLGVDTFNAAPAWDISWDDPDIRPATIEPMTMEFGADNGGEIKRNWNPFPDKIDAAAFEEAFEQRWTDKYSGEAAGSGAGPTCEWLYKNITLDSGGRIFPCCCSPTSKQDLTFGQFEPGDTAHAFNSAKHKSSRLFFADPEAYRAQPSEREPYCVKCDWDKQAYPKPIQIRHYFEGTAPEAFDPSSLKMLSEW